ncbi:SDR family NAD(P)-dependent oxidoreductase [Solirubrobacter deserti]|uniref:SDR family NAD(P)-dependent oxidoreductase n=1 Tax=Solirubrobacter deserti TaxID=2282478 RepID=A0ABT4RUG1_9ACTN|nr:SDR family NAD(P)-dependent oxidoreductase [Solirubrobacter deserti]MDA0142224.1 SDR family NAD(P)-dependent oxidoreductase [Solirubrobacter deserti]
MRRIIITGAAGGIGSATVQLLRSRGAQVVGLDLAGADIECDVRSQESVDRAVSAAIEQLGGLDVLINNAGLGTPQSAAEPPDEAALKVLDVNLVGPWRVTSAALPALRESHGRVVNVASGLAHVTVPFATAYTISKRGVVAYSDLLRLEEGDRVDVTTVYPGYIRTSIHAESQAAGVPLEGAVPVEDVSDAARTLVRAALGAPVRDLATTREGTLTYAVVRLAPRRVVDAITRRQMQRLARKGHFAESGLAGGFVRRISS